MKANLFVASMIGATSLIGAVSIALVMMSGCGEPTARLINPGHTIDVGQALNPAPSLSDQAIKLSCDFFEMGVHVGYSCATHGVSTTEVDPIIRLVREGRYDLAMLLVSNLTSRVETPDPPTVRRVFITNSLSPGGITNLVVIYHGKATLTIITNK